MISKRVTSFFRRITVCQTISLFSFLFILSCQKDEGLKQKDPNALTKSQAKEYFEQTASTLKFLKSCITPTGTKNTDYYLTGNMVIEWDQALAGETEDSYFVEVPISMVSPVTALLYDGLGHLNKNIRQVQVNTSLLIYKHKTDGCIHHSSVTTVGTYSRVPQNFKYSYLSDKDSFSGYQFFCNENGEVLNSNYYVAGNYEKRTVYAESMITKVDSLGKDLVFRGITFITNKLALTKGGGGGSSGEDNVCPNGHNTIQMIYSGMGFISYYCTTCQESFNTFLDPLETCFVCYYPKDNCRCCSTCQSYPCTCPPEGVNGCSLCGKANCDGSSCQLGNLGGGNIPENLCQIIISVDPNTPYGNVSQYPYGEFIESGVNVSIVAAPFYGYHFVGWKVNGNIISTSSQYSFIAGCYQVIYAVFAAD